VAPQTVDAWTALADPTRRGLFARLVARPCSVTELATGLPISRPAVSQHLRVLKEADLVQVRPVGRRRIYAASPEGLTRLRSELDGFWTQALATFKQIAEEGDAEREERRHDHHQ